MKKIFLAFISLMMVISLVSCSTTEKYSILEVGEYDNISGADHKSDISLDIREHSKIFISSKKAVTVNGVEWNVKYDTSKKGYLYRNNLDYYEMDEDGVYVRIGINEDTGRVDSYSWVDEKYIESKTDAELTKEECLSIARTYLSNFIDPDGYETVEIRYMEIPEYKAIYDFEFVRMIDGIETSDKAYVSVSVFGNVISHLFTSLGELADANLPTEEDMQIIQNNVNAKLDAIYKNISNEYHISYEITDKVLIKLSNGKYALEYYITANLETENIPTKLVETTKLLIYLD